MSGQAVSPTALSKLVLQLIATLWGALWSSFHSCVPLEQKQETLAIGSSPELMKSGFLGTDIHFFFFSGLSKGGSQGVGRGSHNVGHIRGF